jgi:hypothetical protein
MEGIEPGTSENALQVGLDEQNEGHILCATTAIETPDALDYESDDEIWRCFDDSAANFFEGEFPVVDFMLLESSYTQTTSPK